MNFLSHAVCADGSGDVIFGATMSDWIETEEIQLSKEITDGRKIHKLQDFLFNSEPALDPFRKELFNLIRHLYDPVLDLMCDHAVARNWTGLFEENFNDYTQWLYGIIGSEIGLIKPRRIEMAEFIIDNNVLASYGTEKGLKEGLSRLAQHSRNGRIVKDNIEGILLIFPEAEPVILGLLPAIYQKSQARLRELRYQPEGRLHWREGFLSGETFNRPNPEKR